jgi:class 3 adenylate cyclase
VPLYLDVHRGLDVTEEMVNEAHLKDMEAQSRHSVNYLTYWFNRERGHIFCLVDAPTADAAVAVHTEAHGLVPQQIIEVQPEMVHAFLDTRMDLMPFEQRVDEPGSPIDGGFRAIMFTDMEDSTPLTQHLGDDAMMALLRAHDQVIRECLTAADGREVKHTGDGIMASFRSAARAVGCAIDIQRAFAARPSGGAGRAIRVRIGISAGEPIEESDDLFGASVNLARRVCDHAAPGEIVISSVVHDLCIGKQFPFGDRRQVELKGFSGPIHVHHVTWRDGAVAK